MLQFGLAHQNLALGRLDPQTAKMVRLEYQRRTRSEYYFDPVAVDHHRRSAIKRPGVERRPARVDAVMNRTHAAADLDRLAMKLVHLPTDREAHVLAHAGRDRLLRSRGVGDIPDNRALGLLLEQFGEQRGAVAGRTGAAAVRKVPD